MMTAWRDRWAAPALRRSLWGIAMTLSLAAPSAAQGPPASPPAAAHLTPIEAALQRTRQSGEPTLVLVTARANPATQDLWRSLVQGHASWTRGRSVLLTQIAIEDLGQRARPLGVWQAPAILLFQREGSDIRLTGQHSGSMDLNFIADWVALSCRAGAAKAANAPDPELVRAAYAESPSAQAQATPQQPQASLPPTPKAAPPAPQPAPQPYYPPQQQYVPVYPAPQPVPMVYSPPQPPIYVQPSAPMIVMGPAPPPTVAYAGAPPAYAPGPPAGSAPPNLLSPPGLAPPAPPPTGSAPPAPPPTGSAPPAAAPPGYGSAPPMAYAPAPAAAAPPAPSAAAAPVPILTNPSLFNRLLGTVGEALAERRNPRIRMAYSPAYAPAVYTAPPAYPMVPAYPAAPAPPPAYAPPPAEQPPPQPIYPGPQPSPQTSQEGHLHGFFRKHFSKAGAN